MPTYNVKISQSQIWHIDAEDEREAFSKAIDVSNKHYVEGTQGPMIEATAIDIARMV